MDQRHVDLATLIHEYDPRFSLAYIPERDRNALGTDKPFAIQERRNDGSVVAIREISNEEMNNPAAILTWIAKGDVARRGTWTVFQELEAQRLAEMALQAAREEEEAADRRDMVAALAGGGRDRKHYYRHNGKTFRR